MAVASDSTPTPARPLLPFADPRTAVDDLRREMERQEVSAQVGPKLLSAEPEPVLPASAPLPSLRTALSRRAALFGAVAATGFLEAAAVDALPARASALSSNDARLVELADAYEALEKLCNAHSAAHRRDDTREAEEEFNALTVGFSPMEIEIAATPADTIVGVLAKARAFQVPTMRHCADEDLLLSVADDVWRLHAAGGLV